MEAGSVVECNERSVVLDLTDNGVLQVVVVGVQSDQAGKRGDREG